MGKAGKTVIKNFNQHHDLLLTKNIITKHRGVPYSIDVGTFAANNQAIIEKQDSVLALVWNMQKSKLVRIEWRKNSLETLVDLYL